MTLAQAHAVMTATHPDWLDVRVEMLDFARRAGPTLQQSRHPYEALDELYHAVTGAPGCASVRLEVDA